MKHLFIPYEIAIKLKENGFEEQCFGGYSDTKELKITTVSFQSDINGFCLAPMYQQVMDWFMNKHQIFIDIGTDCTTYPKFAFDIHRFIGNPKDLTEREWDWENVKVKEWFLYRTRKEAMDCAIEEALKLI